MMAMKKLLEREPGEIEMLLPWHAAGTLNARDARRVEEALARDPELSRQFAVIREEYAETIALNESLGAPSARAMQSLFAAIDAEPERKPTSRGISRGIAGLFAALTPRTLAWSASLAAVVLLVQAGIIGEMLMRNSPASFQTASLGGSDEPIVRSLRSESPPRALVRFEPDARIADITALLNTYHATIIGARGGMFRLQFGDRAMSDDEAAALMRKLDGEKIVSVAVAAP